MFVGFEFLVAAKFKTISLCFNHSVFAEPVRHQPQVRRKKKMTAAATAETAAIAEMTATVAITARAIAVAAAVLAVAAVISSQQQ